MSVWRRAFKSRARWLAAALAPLALFACAPKHADFALSRDTSIFKIGGRISAVVGDSRVRERFTWRRSAIDGAIEDSLQIIDSFGTARARLVVSPAGAALTARGRTRRAPDAQAFAREALGFDLPLHALGFWIVGIADPRAPAKETISAGRVTAIEQHGWRVDFLRARDDGLPEIAALAGAGARATVSIRWIRTPFDAAFEAGLGDAEN